jgi:3-phenylpropionate/trans-cinnamate dioxygenase ferredoxin reductase subunit
VGAGVVIVGAGMGGRAAALAVRKAGYADPVVLIGEERHAPYDRPPLSKDVPFGGADAATVIRPDLDAYAAAAIDLRLATPVAEVAAGTREVVLAAGERVPYEHLVLATGAAPRVPPLDGVELPGVHRVGDLDDALALRDALVDGARRVAIVGGGFIGMELACGLVAHGHRAVVVEMAPQPLAGPLGEEVAGVVAGWAAADGVDIRAGTGVEAIMGTDAAEGLVLAGGEEIPADLVVVAIGVQPRLALAESAGCELAAGGVLVDASLRTSVDGVFAIGDIAAFPSRYADEPEIRVEHEAVAIGHGQAVAREIAEGAGTYDDLPSFWSQQGQRTLNVVGVPRRGDRIVWRGDAAAATCAAFYLREGRLRAALAVGDNKALRGARRLLEAGRTPTDTELSDPAVDLSALAKG